MPTSMHSDAQSASARGQSVAPDGCAAFLQTDSTTAVAAEPAFVRAPLLVCRVKGQALVQDRKADANCILPLAAVQ